MRNAGVIRAGWLLFAVSVGALAACSEEDASIGPTTTTDGSAATAGDGGKASPGNDSGIRPGIDGGQAPQPGVDGGATLIDAAAVLANATLPAPEKASGPEATGVCEVQVNDEACDKSKLPIVFVHGTVANADSFAHPAKLFASNGYCPDRITGIEYHSLIAGPATDAGGLNVDREKTYAAAKAAIDAEIARIRAELGAGTKVDLAGHSQGSGHGSRYASENPDKVAHYIHLAGGLLPADPGGVPTLSLSSIGDRPVDAGTTQSVIFQDMWLDHSAVASSTESFVAMYKFLNNNAEPRYTTVQCGSPITLEGKAQTFADNTPLVGSKVEIYELGTGADPTVRGEAAASYTLKQDAKFGPFVAKPNVAYEFKLIPPPDDTTRRVAHAYMQPFVRSDRLLRFNFETKDPAASATSSQVNRDPSFAVIIPRSRQKAFVANRDSLKVDGTEVITRANTLTVAGSTARSAVTVAYYLFDKSLTSGYGPGDGKSTGESIIRGAFVNSADMFISSAPPKFVEVTFNGKTLRVPNWPSTTEGASVVFLN